jgi:hypothetical protein
VAVVVTLNVVAVVAVPVCNPTTGVVESAPEISTTVTSWMVAADGSVTVTVPAVGDAGPHAHQPRAPPVAFPPEAKAENAVHVSAPAPAWVDEMVPCAFDVVPPVFADSTRISASVAGVHDDEVTVVAAAGVADATTVGVPSATGCYTTKADAARPTLTPRSG